MPNLVEVVYKQTGESTKINKMGMREMQERAYQARDCSIFAFKGSACLGEVSSIYVYCFGQLFLKSKKRYQVPFLITKLMPKACCGIIFAVNNSVVLDLKDNK